MAEATSCSFYQGAVYSSEFFKSVLTDWDETLNISKLCLKVSEITNYFFSVTLPRGVQSSFTAFNELTGARNIFKRTYELISGDAAYEKEGKDRIGNASFCRVASKVAQMVGDCCSVAKWLKSCDLIEKKLFEITGHIRAFGRSFKVMQGIQDASGFLSGVFMFPTNIHALWEGCSALGVKGLLRRTYLFDLMQDVTKVAGIILMNIPGVSPIYAAVTMTVGSCISLARFVKKAYCTDRNGRDRPVLEA
jgi:hypothetical protein